MARTLDVVENAACPDGYAAKSGFEPTHGFGLSDSRVPSPKTFVNATPRGFHFL